jgi:hypothetical protein
MIKITADEFKTGNDGIHPPAETAAIIQAIISNVNPVTRFTAFLNPLARSLPGHKTNHL